MNNLKKLDRVVVLGSKGFIGNAICKKLNNLGCDYLPLSRSEIDLSEDDAETKLISYIKDGDILVASAAVAPVKNLNMFIQNLKITNSICKALSQVKLSYFLNISSDAIYEDTKNFLTESSIKSPFSFHGAMHLSREIAFDKITQKQGTLCPTLVYGPGDPHNGYGPNQFCRLLKNSENIKIFGEGEEKRDHIYINDVAKIAYLMMKHKVVDRINAVSGTVISFKEIAEKCIKINNSKQNIISIPRNGPMPHNGYRAFDTKKLISYFHDFEFTKLDQGIKEIFKKA